MGDAKRWAVPVKVDGVAGVFGASGRELARLLPPMSELPEAFRDERDPWCGVVQRWFFSGLPKGTLRPKPGIDHGAALAHCAAILRSFEPKQEHKVAGVAWLMSQWFDVAAPQVQS